MVKNGIPPNAKIPSFIADRIENRAKEMKKMKGGAMLAYNEESGNDSSDNNETDDEGDGAAFVATCYWVDANGIAHLNDGDDEDGDDHEQGTNARGRAGLSCSALGRCRVPCAVASSFGCSKFR